MEFGSLKDLTSDAAAGKRRGRGGQFEVREAICDDGGAEGSYNDVEVQYVCVMRPL